MTLLSEKSNRVSHSSIPYYRFVYSSNMSALLAEGGGETLLQFQRPDAAGVQTSYQFEFEHFDRDYFVGLVAFDERSNEGKLSNIVSVFVDSSNVATIPGDGGGDGGSGGSKNYTEPRIDYFRLNIGCGS